MFFLLNNFNFLVLGSQYFWFWGANTETIFILILPVSARLHNFFDVKRNAWVQVRTRGVLTSAPVETATRKSGDLS